MKTEPSKKLLVTHPDPEFRAKEFTSMKDIAHWGYEVYGMWVRWDRPLAWARKLRQQLFWGKAKQENLNRKYLREKKVNE